MTTLLIVLFVITYLAIALEHMLHINKSASALLGAGLLWTIYAVTATDPALVSEELGHTVAETAQIIFFLIGAMTIVEVVDAHNGFDVVTARVQTKSLAGLLCLIASITFFLSAILDNLTATIVMVSLVRKLLKEHEERLFFAGMIVIAANAGGAWSPIGDVTTTMLWIGHKVSTAPLILNTFIPSLLCIITPLIIARWLPAFKGNLTQGAINKSTNGRTELLIGISLFLMVPLLKSLFHLPPYMGMLLALCLFALYAEIKTKRNFKMTEVESDLSPQSPTMKSLQKVELPTILFFLGILLTVAALESIGFIFNLGQSVQRAGISTQLFMGILGIASAVIDNVPLVAGAMGMFSYPMDHEAWHLLAYTAGTGGSILIIGSAAGVVAMGIEKISFSWYLKRIAPLAFIGYAVGYLFMRLIV